MSTPIKDSKTAGKSTNMYTSQGMTPKGPSGVVSPNSASPVPVSTIHMTNAKQATSSQLTHPVTLGEGSSREWCELLTNVGGVHGKAVIDLARLLLSRRHADTLLRGAQLAADLLDGADKQTCENLVTLLGDGWEQSLASLLACARRI